MRILLVEDEPELSRMLIEALSRDGIVVDHASSLAIGREALLNAEHDAMVLDRSLPDGDGLELIAFGRFAKRSCPVIVLTALGALSQRVEGLDTGADDYLIKPFAMDELRARLRAITRRGTSAPQQTVRIGKLVFDLGHRSAEIDGVPLVLPRREALALEALARRAGRVVPRRMLEEAVYGYDDDIASNTLEAHISRLRRKLGPAGIEIHAMRGIGYLMRHTE